MPGGVARNTRTDHITNNPESPRQERPPSLSELGDDILLHLLFLLSLRDLLSIKQTSKFFYNLCSLPATWSHCLKTFVQDYGNPIPFFQPHQPDAYPAGWSQETTSSIIPEKCTRQSILFQRNWESAVPILHRETRGQTDASKVAVLKFLPEIYRNTDVQRAFLPRSKPPNNNSDGRDDNVPDTWAHRYLVSFGYTPEDRPILQVWDSFSASLNTLGDREESSSMFSELGSHRVVGLVVNDLPHQAITYAMTHANASQTHISLHKFDPDRPDVDYVGPVELVGVLDFGAQTLGLSGDILVLHFVLTDDPELQDKIVLYHWRTQRRVEVRLTESHSAGQRSRVLKVLVVEDHLLLFHEACLELYHFPRDYLSDTDIPINGGQPPVISPIAIHSWPWKINNIAVSERVSFHRKYAKTPNPSAYNPISIVIRYDSWFPWPVNLLHHYVLNPSSDYNPNALSSTNLHYDHSPPLRTSAPNLMRRLAPGAGAAGGQGTSAGSDADTLADQWHIPYIFPPRLHDTIPSTVRLFARAAMSIGPYGGLVWMDSDAASGSNAVNASKARGASEKTRTGSADTRYQNSNQGWSAEEGVGERLAGRRLGLGRTCCVCETCMAWATKSDHTNASVQNSAPEVPEQTSSPRPNEHAQAENDRSSQVTSQGEDTAATDPVLTITEPPLPLTPELPLPSITLRPQHESQRQTSTFGLRAQDGWTALCLDEHSGRAAVGNENGGISIMDFCCS